MTYRKIVYSEHALVRLGEHKIRVLEDAHRIEVITVYPVD